MKKESSIENLSNAITFNIECTKCTTHDSTWSSVGDGDDFAQELYDKGWRGTDNHIYCPTCAKTFKLK